MRKQFPLMRALFLSVLLAFTVISQASAGRLDVAIILFPEEKEAGQLEAVLAGVSLFEITNSDRTMTTENYLKGGYVVYAQSIPVSRGSGFSVSTRIRNNRADIEGRLGSADVDFTVTLIEGVKAGLRNFEKKTYNGAGLLPSGPATIISMRQAKSKFPLVTKGQAVMKGGRFTSVIAAQYTP